MYPQNNIISIKQVFAILQRNIIRNEQIMRCIMCLMYLSLFYIIKQKSKKMLIICYHNHPYLKRSVALIIKCLVFNLPRVNLVRRGTTYSKRVTLLKKNCCFNN